jgi:hypothetical protein
LAGTAPRSTSLWERCKHTALIKREDSVTDIDALCGMQVETKIQQIGELVQQRDRAQADLSAASEIIKAKVRSW